MDNKFFKSESERELWIKLNAERQIEWEKGLKYFDRDSQTWKPTHQALNPRSMDTALQISRNQLVYDEKNEDKPRYSLHELLTLTIEDLNEIDKNKRKELFKNFK